MTIFAVQYLESPYPDATPNSVRRRLREACERLPISLVLLGWELPPALEEAVAQEASRQHAQLYRWQPLLTGDAHTDVPLEWTTLGSYANPIPGHGGLPEFTFICPNRSAVADFLSERVESVAACGLFQGIFFDRIRFPSPSLDPLRHLACFCEHCCRLAADAGLDLESVRRFIQLLPADRVIRELFAHNDGLSSPLDSFLNFRSSCITRTVQAVSSQARIYNLSIGLDCFSPALTRMVGQDLSALNGTADWLKIMSYPRVFGPAGLPFELLGVAEWLNTKGFDENKALDLLSDASRLTIPINKAALGNVGLASETIAHEIQRGYELGVTKLLAGIAMVKMEKIHESSSEQILADLEASRLADGLVISWDLWLTPLEYLNTIRALWS